MINAHHFALPDRPEAPDRPPRPPLPEPWRYIGRSTPLGPSPLANPFTVAQHGMEALQLYRRWLWARIKADDRAVLAELRAIEPGEHLVCHCKRPDGSGACHGDVVGLAWEWLRGQDAKGAKARELERRLEAAEAEALVRGGWSPAPVSGEIVLFG